MVLFRHNIRSSFIILLVFQFLFSTGQEDSSVFHSPLDIPLFLSGNFGELRQDHFHSGIDIKTQGVTGKKVYAVENGYISRIKIQASGYGNSLYITHPSGFTTVYAHLESFDREITGYVRNYQYKNQTFTLDIYPDKDLFLIKKGQVIALSGNSGSSGGPHLHFEIRNPAQHPRNALLYSFEIKDNIPPPLQNLFIYPLGMTSPGKYPDPKVLPLKKNNGKYHLSGADTLELKGRIGLGLETYDLLNEIPNPCGIYSIELFINEEIIYVFRMDEFSFSSSSYINAHIDYKARLEKDRKVHLLYRKPNNLLGLYPLLVNDGVLNFPSGEISRVLIRVKDAYQNTSELEFFVKGSGAGIIPRNNEQITENLFLWHQPNYYEDSQISITVPASSLYEDYDFFYSRTNEGPQTVYPYMHLIGESFIPLNKPCDVSLNGLSVPEELRSKTFIAGVNGNNRLFCLNSRWKGSRINAKINKFGKYTLVVDTIPPVIQAINIRNGWDLSAEQSLRFRVTDDLSGISEYRGYIDHSWVLFEYDPKNELLFYTFDPERIEKGSNHNLELIVTDLAGNEKQFVSEFLW